MAIVVRPSASRLSAREMRTSVSASTDEVASSRTSTSGSAIPARRMATSWRSPADRFSPRSPTLVSSPSLSESIQSSSSSRRTIASMSGIDVPGLANPTLAAIGVVEQERLLGHDDEALAQLVVGHALQRHSAEVQLANGGVGEAGDQPSEGRLARTGGADEGDLLTGGNRHVDVAQHGLVERRRDPPRRDRRT